MDADSPLVSRLERTFWTVWYYISGAVQRLLRPEQENNVSNNPSSVQESAADSELAEFPHEDGVSGGEVQKEQTLETASPLSSSRPAVAWDLCSSEIDLAPDEKHIQYTADLKDPKTDEDAGEDEEGCIRTRDGELWLLVAKSNKAEKDDGVNQEVFTHRQVETLEDDKSDESTITRSQNVLKDATSGDTAGAVETKTPDFQNVEETPIKVQDQEEGGLHLKTDSSEINLSTITDLCPEEEVIMHEEEETGRRNLAEGEIPKSVLLSSGDEIKSDENTLRDDRGDYVGGDFQMASNTSVPMSEDELMIAGLEYAMAPRNSNERSDIVDERMESPVEQEEQKIVIKDEKVNMAEVSETQTVTGDSKGEVNSSAQMWCIDEVLLHAETELHMEERLEDVVKDSSVQIMITEMEDGETETYGAVTNEESAVKSSKEPANECLFDKKQVQDDNLKGEPEGGTGQEVSCEFGNVPECVFKGQSLVAQGPQPVQGGAPESIDEPEPDENTAQRFQEVWSTPLPEEVDNQEPESLQNNSTNTEALALREHTEKRQDSRENRESYLDLVGNEQETEKQHFHTLVEEAGLISVEENRELVSSSRTEIDDLGKEFESDFSLMTKKELQDRDDVLLDMDKELYNPNEAGYTGERFIETESLGSEETVGLLKAGEQIEKTSLQDSEDAFSSGQNINKTLSLIENITATEFLEQPTTELQLLTETEWQHAETDLEKERNSAEVEVGPELGSAKCPETTFSNKQETKKDEDQLVGSNSGDSELVSDTETSSSTTESGFSNQLLSDQGTQSSESHLLKPVTSQSVQDMFGNVSESVTVPKLSPQQLDSECQDAVMRRTDEAGQLYLKDNESVVQNLNQESEETKDNTDKDYRSQKEINLEGKGLSAKMGLKTTEEDDVMALREVSSFFKVEENQFEADALIVTLSDSLDESKHTESSCTRNSSDAWSEEGTLSTECSLHDNTSVGSEKGSPELPSVDKLQHNSLEDIQNRSEVEDQLTTESEYQSQADGSALDFTAQRSRIAVKNPQVRRPKDPRSLILMSSLDPTPAPPLLLLAKLPSDGVGIRIKLPGLGAGFPGLKKTQQRGKDETRPDSNNKESEIRSEKTNDDPKQDEKQRQRKWMPPRHPGFGNPLMSELKTRLNKTTKD